MTARDYSLSYEGTSVFDHVRRHAPCPSETPVDDPFYVYIMGPYTAFDAEHAFTDAGNLKTPYIDDPLFDTNRHVDRHGRSDYEAALADLCETLRDQLGVRAFLATDIKSIPTVQEASGEEAGMSVLDQSVGFAAVSDAVIFVLTRAGLTTGVGSEIGAILSDFNLRRGNPEPERKPRERIGLFPHVDFSSGSIDEAPYTYDIASREFRTKTDLCQKIQGFLVNIQRTAAEEPLSIFNPY